MSRLFMSFSTARPRVLMALAASLLLTACATGPDAHPRDPMESFNRGVYEFNDAVDTAVLRPVATAYRDVTPDPVRTGVSNFFNNLGDAWSFVNAVLQLRPREAAENLLRFNFNTVFGLGGVLDIASEMGIERTKLDFGLTLGRWGVPPGPYVVLPLLGPSSVRDTVGVGVDSSSDLVGRLDHVATRNSLYGLRIVDTRTKFLRASSVLEGAALDKYSFTRDVYLQRRESQIESLFDQDEGWSDTESDK